MIKISEKARENHKKKMAFRKKATKKARKMSEYFWQKKRMEEDIIEFKRNNSIA